jgi:hypothetical protein
VIPAQIPSDRDHWPPDLLEHLRGFQQGHVVTDIPYFYLGDPSRPVLELTAAFADDGPGIIEAKAPFPYGLIATQTCDIAEEDAPRPSQPWIHVCPVYDAETRIRPAGTDPATPDAELPKLLDGRTRSLVRQGRSQHLLHLPGLGPGCWVADLRLLLPIEKGWLAARTPINPFPTEAQRIEVGRRLAWIHLRPAFDGVFVRTVQQPLVAALRQLRREEPDKWERLHDQAREIGVSTKENITIHTAELVVICNSPLDDDLATWLEERWTELHELADADRLNLLPLRIVTLNDLTAAEYVTMTRLPLAAVSPNPAWYGEDPSALPNA